MLEPDSRGYRELALEDGYAVDGLGNAPRYKVCCPALEQTLLPYASGNMALIIFQHEGLCSALYLLCQSESSKALMQGMLLGCARPGL